MLSVQDRAKVLGVSADSVDLPRQVLFDSSGGIPLFWQERKPVKLWRKTFEDFQAFVVVDLSPGGGLAARAAMEMGLTYWGLTRSAEQSQWLGNVCDRNALRAAVTAGTALFSQDLQGSIEEHFVDVLAHLRDADAVEDKEGPEDDVDEP